MNAAHDLLHVFAKSSEHKSPVDTAESIDGIETGTLCYDVAWILLECHRDRNLPKLFAPDVDSAALKQFAGVLARRLGPLIGGRYVPKVDSRAARDLAVLGAFTGRNHKDVMHQFRISRRLLYSILARKRHVLQPK